MAESNDGMDGSNDESPVLHIVTAGFNHLKGWQVEFSYPPFGQDGNTGTCPEQWKYLAHLAIPDGSHNFEEDTVFFHLPSLKDDGKTIFAIGCYRQINADRVHNKGSDVTRRSIQKSIVILSSLPLYHKIEVKLSLIASAYFEQADFSQHDLLREGFTNLQRCLEPPLEPGVYEGLQATDLLLHFGHETLLLLKLLLLEKRVLFFNSPVKPLCRAILTLISLIPGTIERGLDNCVSARKLKSGEINVNNSDIHISSQDFSHSAVEDVDLQSLEDSLTENSVADSSFVPLSPTVSVTELHGSKSSINSESSIRGIVSSESFTNITTKLSSIKSKIGNALWRGNQEPQEGAPEGMEPIAQPSPSPVTVVDLMDEECGFPLRLFGDGYTLHPYISLSNMDVLSANGVDAYVTGTSNAMLLEKKELFDVQIELETRRIEFHDADLRRQLRLTTEDLRFVDSIVRQVEGERHELFVDGVGWHGGENWIRLQFRTFLIQLLRTSLLDETSKEVEPFNALYVQAFKRTRNYRRWLEAEHAAIMQVMPGHPGSGQLSVADVKLRLSHTIQTTESGRKLSGAAATTGRAVAQTGKAVGDVIAQARGSLTAWWSGSSTL